MEGVILGVIEGVPIVSGIVHPQSHVLGRFDAKVIVAAQQTLPMVLVVPIAIIDDVVRT